MYDILFRQQTKRSINNPIILIHINGLVNIAFSPQNDSVVFTQFLVSIPHYASTTTNWILTFFLILFTVCFPVDNGKYVFPFVISRQKIKLREKSGFEVAKVTMFVIQMKNALRGLSAPAAWQTPEKFFI